MLQTASTLIRRLAPPVLARNSAEKLLAEKAGERRFTWFDAVFLFVLLQDLILTAIDATTRWWYVGYIEVELTLYFVAMLLFVRGLRPLLGRLMLVGLIAGICELFTDASGQYVVHSLIYPTGQPTLWTSPLYMPLAWLISFTQTGYVAWRLRELLGLRKATIAAGIWGAIQIPVFEELSYYGGWWRYIPTRLILGHTPAYVLLFEGLIVAALPLFFNRLERRAWPQVVVIGLIIGAWMPTAGLFSWLLLGH